MAKNTEKSVEKHFSARLPYVYANMADILERRGVYDTALGYAKEAVNLKPDYSFAMETEATIYEHQERYSECVAVAKEAIRVSDGQFPSMQFRLGNCYYDLEQWSQAANSFKIAAEADKTDVSSAYNLALSPKHQGFGEDAKIWFQEALRRNPDATLRPKILDALR